MKKFVLCLIGFFVLLSGVAFAGSKTKQHINFNNKKIVVTYYTVSGNTKYVAQQIHSQVGGDILEIESQKGYPSDYRMLTEVAKYQKENNIYPPLKTDMDVSDYDIVFVGTPVWWGTMAMPVKTFITYGKFKNKAVIIPFITHGGGGGYDIAAQMQAMTKSDVITRPLVIKEKGSTNLDNDIKSWIKSLK